MASVSNIKSAEITQNVKPSVWVEFTQLAVEHKAVNLGQGFPDTPMPKFVADCMKHVAEHPEMVGWHQYTRGFGHARLVNVLAKLYGDVYGVKIDPMNEILVTVGAYMALYYAFNGWINKGDQVIIIEPAYDCYLPQVIACGGVPVPITMKLKKNATTSADYILDLNELESKINEKTKMIVVNNPHNPTGKLYTRQELEGIADLAKKYNLLVIADEVYEYHVWDTETIRMASLPGMWERTISVGSAGKVFSVTGWKTGWALAPAHLLGPLKTVHQNCIFTLNTPTQESLAQAFEKEVEIIAKDISQSYLRKGLSSELKAKRDRLASMLNKAGFKPIIPDSGYFMMADFSNFKGPFLEEKPGDDPLDFRFVRWLCKEKKLATIPPTAFYSEQFKKDNENLIRLCYFKKDETLDAAEKILDEFAKEQGLAK
ncbi:hypothetical protein WR25_03814 [Diploscapter pachys]|uniref:Aminotransferase class I/classII large domain-containing protein n=1 Tax=Diploscapter pachys TaxID=2018661 RepID=A0A2A2J2G4_9BILA|nr:hypothetical protein WR25_03814 [Diploscapter pachys]